MLWQQQLNTVELGWDFYLPVLIFVVMCALAIPVWAAIGAAAIAMLYLSGALPLSSMTVTRSPGPTSQSSRRQPPFS